MFRLMVMDRHIDKATVKKLKRSHRPDCIISTYGGPSDLVFGRWEDIELGLSKALRKKGDSKEIEAILVGRIGQFETTDTVCCEFHDELVTEEIAMLESAKKHVVDLINHKTDGDSIHPVLIIVDYINNEIHKIEDLGA